MDRFDTLRLFVRIVECRSFTTAAAALDVPRATATNAIKELEARLGTRLLERTTRQVNPTPDGRLFHQRCLKVLADLEDAEASFHTEGSRLRGTLRLDLHGTHATRIVLPRIDEFQARYPDVEILVSTGDRLVDLIAEGIDCVIRAGSPRDSSLVARRLALMPQVVCCAPEYVARFGVPNGLDDLPDHQAVGFFNKTNDASFPFELEVDGRVESIALRSSIAVTDAESYVACALRGCGLIQLPRFHVEEELAGGRLVEVLSRVPSATLTVSAIYPFHRQPSARVRAFIEWVSSVYRQRFPETDNQSPAP